MTQVKRQVPKDDPVLVEHYPDLMKKLGWPPVVEMEDGTYRFPRNDLVRWLVDEGGVDLNRMSAAFQNGKFPLKEYMGFYQCLGYTLCGFGEVFGEYLWTEEEES